MCAQKKGNHQLNFSSVRDEAKGGAEPVGLCRKNGPRRNVIQLERCGMEVPGGAATELAGPGGG